MSGNTEIVGWLLYTDYLVPFELASMLLLVRATVYRAVFEFADVAPGAVTVLFDETAPLTREIHITAPGKRRGSMQIPEAEAAFPVFEKIVAAGGILPKGGSIGIEPITTAQDAKQHLARYVSEIDQAPQDLDLRHFLGLGALGHALHLAVQGDAAVDGVDVDVDRAHVRVGGEPGLDLGGHRGVGEHLAGHRLDLAAHLPRPDAVRPPPAGAERPGSALRPAPDTRRPWLPSCRPG